MWGEGKGVEGEDRTGPVAVQCAPSFGVPIYREVYTFIIDSHDSLGLLALGNQLSNHTQNRKI